MRHRLLRGLPLSASLFLHAILAAFFLLRWPQPGMEQPPEAVMIELEQESAPAAAAKAKQNGSKPARASENQLSLRSLAPADRSFMQARVNPSATKTTTPDSLSPYSASSDPLASESQGTFSAIAWAHGKLQLSLGYPSAFIRNEIAGPAQARFSFSATGELLHESILVQSDSAYLRVYVHRLIEHTFAGNTVPPELRKWRNQLELYCFVRFSLVESETALTTGMPSPILGNQLHFARRSVKSQLEKLRWQLGPLHGMFPLPTVGVDMLWFARQAEQLAHPRAPVDDLAPYREDPLFYN